jgi:integrase
MFSLAEMWGLRPDGSNPRKHIKKYAEEKRERFLSPAELKRVGEVLREMESEGIELPSAIAATRLLILTGCRLSEIMTLNGSMWTWPARRCACRIRRRAPRLSTSVRPRCDLLDRRSSGSRRTRGSSSA